MLRPGNHASTNGHHEDFIGSKTAFFAAVLVYNVFLYYMAMSVTLGFMSEVCVKHESQGHRFSHEMYIYTYIYVYIYIHHHHHHHHVVPLARISLTLSRHFSLSFIASGRSSGLQPVFSQSCCMYVRAGRPAFGWPYAGVHRSTSLMSSSLLLQQCPACLVRLTCIVFVMRGKWPYSKCLVGCCRQDLFNIARNILV